MSLADESVRLAERLPEGLLRNIVAQLDPQRVIVFGSQATGTTHEDSDWDLLIVVDDDIPPERLHWRAIHDLRRGITAAIDLVPYRASSFQYEEDVVGTLAWTALQEGVVVYERVQK
jgi:uncharacterized protein